MVQSVHDKRLAHIQVSTTIWLIVLSTYCRIQAPREAWQRPMQRMPQNKEKGFTEGAANYTPDSYKFSFLLLEAAEMLERSLLVGKVGLC